MSNTLIEILVIFVLILFNGFFSMSEIAIVSARKVRLEQRADEGDAGAGRALQLSKETGQFLSSVQVGITLVAILMWIVFAIGSPETFFRGNIYQAFMSTTPFFGSSCMRVPPMW